MSRPVQAESQRFGGELAPKIVPLPAALKPKKLLVERARAADVFRIIQRPNRNRLFT
jgi:hypothetical protein